MVKQQSAAAQGACKDKYIVGESNEVTSRSNEYFALVSSWGLPDFLYRSRYIQFLNSKPQKDYCKIWVRICQYGHTRQILYGGATMATSSLDDYDLGQQIGKGGFAAVFRARQRTNGKEVAIKVTRKDSITDAGMMDRVKNEIIIHRKLKHRNIVAFLGCFEDNLNVYIVLELCGGNLFHYLKDRGALPEAIAVGVIQQLISALEYIHNQGIVHRDLKLSNILLTGEQNDQLTIKVCDFGLAVQKEHPDEEHYTLCGTPNYIAPEVASQRAHGYPADLWSVGCLFYTMVVGAPPFEQGDVKDTLERIISGVYTESDKISQEGHSFLRSLLHLNPMQRANVKELLVHPLLSPPPSPSPSLMKEVLGSNHRSPVNARSPEAVFGQQTECASTDVTPTKHNAQPNGSYGNNENTSATVKLDGANTRKPIKSPPAAQWSIERRSSPLSIHHTPSQNNVPTTNNVSPQPAAHVNGAQSASISNTQSERQVLEQQIRDLQTQYQQQYLHNHFPTDGPNGSVTTASTALVSYPSPMYSSHDIPYRGQTAPQQRPPSSGEAARLSSRLPLPPPPAQSPSQSQLVSAPPQRSSASAVISGPTLSSTEPTVSARAKGSPQSAPSAGPSSAATPGGAAPPAEDRRDHNRPVHPPINNATTGQRNSLQYQKSTPSPSHPIGAPHLEPSLRDSGVGAVDARSRSVSISFLHGISEHDDTADDVAVADRTHSSAIMRASVNISAIGSNSALNNNSSMRSSRSSRSWLDNLSDLRSSLNGSAGSAGLRQSLNAQHNHHASYSSPQGPNYSNSHIQNEEMRSWQQQYAYDKFIGTPPSAHRTDTHGASGSPSRQRSTAARTTNTKDAHSVSPADVHRRVRQDMQWLRPFCLTTSRGELLVLTLERDLVLVSKVSTAASVRGQQAAKQNYIRLVLTTATPCAAIIGNVNESMQEETTHIMLDVIHSRELAKQSEVADLNMSSNLDDFVGAVNRSAERDCDVSGFKFHAHYSSAQMRVVSDLHSTRLFPLSDGTDPAASCHDYDQDEQQASTREIPVVVASLLQRAMALLLSVRSRVPKLIVYFAAPVAPVPPTAPAASAVRSGDAKSPPGNVNADAAPQKSGDKSGEKSVKKAGELNCKAMLMSNEPFPDFYMRWTDGVRLRYELHTGRLHFEKPAMRPTEHTGKGSEGGVSKPALRWSGVLNTDAVPDNNSQGIAHSGDILPELVPYAMIAQKALARCLQDMQRSSCSKNRAAVQANPSNPIPKILPLD